VKGFGPHQYFMNHMTSFGFSVSYINIYLYREEEDDENNPKEFLIRDIETIASTNKAHRQHIRVVNEKNKRSQGSSKKNGTPK